MGNGLRNGEMGGASSGSSPDGSSGSLVSCASSMERCSCSAAPLPVGSALDIAGDAVACGCRHGTPSTLES